MDSDKAKKWITLGANLGVLIGIFLLIVELQQNREMMRAQTRTDIAAMSIDRLQAIASDQGLADIVRRARFGEELGDTKARVICSTPWRHFALLRMCTINIDLVCLMSRNLPASSNHFSS
jgi:hypothetical protein